MAKYSKNCGPNATGNFDDGICTLPNGYKPINMENVEEHLRLQGAIDTNEFLEIINKY